MQSNLQANMKSLKLRAVSLQFNNHEHQKNIDFNQNSQNNRKDCYLNFQNFDNLNQFNNQNEFSDPNPNQLQDQQYDFYQNYDDTQIHQNYSNSNQDSQAMNNDQCQQYYIYDTLNVDQDITQQTSDQTQYQYNQYGDLTQQSMQATDLSLVTNSLKLKEQNKINDKNSKKVLDDQIKSMSKKLTKDTTTGIRKAINITYKEAGFIQEFLMINEQLYDKDLKRLRNIEDAKKYYEKNKIKRQLLRDFERRKTLIKQLEPYVDFSKIDKFQKEIKKE